MADDLSDITDDELVCRPAADDQSAWAAPGDRHLSPVASFAWYRLGDRVEAEDIAQETLLRFAKKALTREPDGAKIRTWLYRVAGNLRIDRQRARKPHSPLEDIEDTSIIDIQPHLDGKLDARRVVHKALIALPARQQVVLILVYYQGYTVKEAAVMLEVSEHAAESLLARARRAMRAALEPNREDLIGAGS